MHQSMQTTLQQPAALFACESADRDRIDRLVRQHFDLVWRYLRRLGLSDADADDAAQQVFLTLSRKLNQVDRGSERAYLLGVCVRVAADVRKSRRRRASSEALTEHDFAVAAAAHPGPNPEQALEQQRACALLDRLLGDVDPDARAVLVLYEIEGLTLQEIAAALDKPQGTVASRLRRGRAKFQAAVARFRASGEKGEGER